MVAVVVHNEKGKEKILLLSFLLIEDYDRISRNLHGEASFAYKYILRFPKNPILGGNHAVFPFIYCMSIHIKNLLSIL